jgi:hypothetical protein
MSLCHKRMTIHCARDIVVGVVTYVLIAKKLVALVRTFTISIKLFNKGCGFGQFSNKMLPRQTVNKYGNQICGFRNYFLLLQY